MFKSNQIKCRFHSLYLKVQDKNPKIKDKIKMHFFYLKKEGYIIDNLLYIIQAGPLRHFFAEIKVLTFGRVCSKMVEIHFLDPGVLTFRPQGNRKGQ